MSLDKTRTFARTVHLNMLLGVCVLLLPHASLAKPVTPQDAQDVVTGWLNVDAQPLGAVLGEAIGEVVGVSDDGGQLLYYVVYLQPNGLVIVPADNWAEPIVAFSAGSTFDPSDENPLGALVAEDLRQRMAIVRGLQQGKAAASPDHAQVALAKWHELIGYAASGKPKGLSSVDDERVAPLVQSRWSQGDAHGGYCYNYYTPNHYVCGCTATALAQLLRFHEHPATGVGTPSFTIKVDGVGQSASLRGGDGSGGPYVWNDMVLVPNDGVTEGERQAIGALTYDSGVSVRMSYTASSSGADGLRTAEALEDTFGYANARKGYRGAIDIGYQLVGMVNPNLDAGYPAILGIARPGVGHTIVCDGYGYNNSTLYHHLNMGWAGGSDAWYDLPDCSPLAYDTVRKCVYNVFPSGKGEIISGRVTDAEGEPLGGTVVTAVTEGGGVYTTTAGTNGIYAFSRIPASTTYTMSAAKTGYGFSPHLVSTTVSTDYSAASGNRWAIDFVGAGPVPIAQGTTLWTDPDTPLDITVSAADDGLPNPPGALSYRITSLPTAGSLSDPLAGPISTVPYTLTSPGIEVHYSPDPGHLGADSFQFLADDGGTPPDGGASTTATVSIITQGQVVFVDADATGANTGYRWADAYVDLQTALDAASLSEGHLKQIWVAAGTYTPSALTDPADSRTATFALLDGVIIYGGFAGTETDPSERDLSNPANHTILSGDLAGNDGADFANYDENAYHVVSAWGGITSSAILDGVQIRGGHADGPGDRDQDYGGAFLCEGSPTLRHCTFTENLAVNYGGAVYIHFSASAHFSDCTFTGNMAADAVAGSGWGGAIYNYSDSTVTFTDCTFLGNNAYNNGGAVVCRGRTNFTDCDIVNNEARWGGGIYTNYAGVIVTIRGGSISGNRSQYYVDTGGGMGGAMRIGGGADVTLVDCVLSSNEGYWGGGLYISLESTSVDVRDCTFASNSAHYDAGGNYGGYGGGIYLSYDSSLTLSACTFTGNDAYKDGGALSTESAPTITHCRFLENTAGDDGGAIRNYMGDVHLRGCLFIGNSAGNSTGNHGGAVYDGSGDTSTGVLSMDNCTYWHNDCGGRGGAVCVIGTSAPGFTNCILWGNTATVADPQIYGASATVDYSCVEGGWSGTENTGSDPVFVDRDGADNVAGNEDDDTRLSAGSPCIDVGDNAVTVLCGLDLDGKERRTDDPATSDGGNGTAPLVDIGPYEFAGVAGTDCDSNGLDDDCEVAQGLTADCNGNGVADACDVASGAYDDCDGSGVPDVCELDTDGDGLIDPCDADDDNDGVADASDIAPTNAGICGDSEGDSCDDCAVGRDGLGPLSDNDPSNDGPDADNDGFCDAEDNCDLPNPDQADCQPNGIGDVCDLAYCAGEPWCDDCNGNGVPDDCDIAGGTSSDTNGNGVPDECEANPPLPAPAPDDEPKNRYVSFDANNSTPVALQVEMVASAYFPGSTGVLGWVGEPFEAPEDPSAWIARVVDTAFYTDSWPEVIHLGDCPIVPAASYALRATPDEIVFSDPLEIATIAQPTPKYWADCVGALEEGGWTAPNEVVNMDDVVAAVQKFKWVETAPPLTWVDLDGEVPNAVLNFGDIQMIVNGFKSEPYPFSDPADCP